MAVVSGCSMTPGLLQADAEQGRPHQQNDAPAVEPAGVLSDQSFSAAAARQLEDYQRGQVTGLSSSPAPAEHGIEAGQCWVYAQVKPRPVQRSLEIVVKDSVNKISVTPAQLRDGFTQVVTREGTKTYRIEPPTYKEVSEQVMVRPEVTRYVVVPAVYEEREETVTLEEAKTVLDTCRTAGTRYAQNTGVMAFCAREVPAKQEVIKVKELVEPETVQAEIEPAEYKTITRWVVDTPAQAIEEAIDPELIELATAEMIKPVQATQVILPEVKKEMQVTRFEGTARIVSRQAVCDSDITAELITKVQYSLARRGFSPGRVDGLLGTRTLGGLTAFQEANGLAVGALTLESLAALEVD